MPLDEDMRQITRRMSRPGVGRRASLGEALASDIGGAESLISQAAKIPLTKLPSKPPRQIGLGPTGGRISRSASSDLLDLHLFKGGEAAKSYLAKKAESAGTLGKMGTAIEEAVPSMVKGAAKSVGEAAGLIGTAADLGSAVIGFQRAKLQKQKAELGTKLLQSGMKSARLKKSLSQPTPEGIPGDVKVY